MARALQVKASGHFHHALRPSSSPWTPRDHYANFSAVIYQNLGTTLAPLAACWAPLPPRARRVRRTPSQGLGNMKPTLVAAYGEPDRITMASAADVLGIRA